MTLMYAVGDSDIGADDVFSMTDRSGGKVHLLGTRPPKQYSVIEDLPQPRITGDPPPDIVGLNWNGPHRGGLMYEYRSREGCQPPDYLSIWATERESL